MHLFNFFGHRPLNNSYIYLEIKLHSIQMTIAFNKKVGE